MKNCSQAENFLYIIQQKIIVYKTTLLFSSKKSSLQVSGKLNSLSENGEASSQIVFQNIYLHQLHELIIYGVITPSSPSI